MKQQAIDELNNAAGRTLSNTELQGLQDRAEAAFHDLKAEDPIAWRALPIGERISRAAELAHMRHKAAVLAQQRRQIARALSMLGAAPVRGTSSGPQWPATTDDVALRNKSSRIIDKPLTPPLSSSNVWEDPRRPPGAVLACRWCFLFCNHRDLSAV